MDTVVRPPITCTGWCYSQMEKDTVYDYAWTIERFSQLLPTHKYGKTMYSEQFVIMVNGRETKWRLAMYPNGRKEEDSGYVTLFLKDSGKLTPANVRAQVKFSVVNGAGDLVNSRVIDKEYKVLNHAFGYSKFLKHSSLLAPEHGMMTEDRLTLFCNINIINGKFTSYKGTQWQPPSNQPSTSLTQLSPLPGKLGVNLGDLLSDPKDKFSDVVLVVGESMEEFHCHRNILSARSPVFRAMFQYDMAESQSNRVKIPDVDPGVMRQLLHYVYTGTYEEGLELELLVAADKYSLLELKGHCEYVLCDEIEVTKVLSLLVIADRHDATVLKNMCVDMIMEKSREIVQQPDWKKYLEPYPKLLSEMFEILASSPPAKRRRLC